MWLVYALLTIVGYTGMDFFVKKASGKIDDFLGIVIINTFAFLPPFLAYLWLKFSGKEILFSKDGAFFSVIAGLFIGFAMISFMKMFSAGTNLSVGTPLVRIGTVILAVLLGIFFLKETLNLRQIAGLILALIGLAIVFIK